MPPKYEPSFECVDCAQNTSDIDEYYMVTNEIWAEAGMTELNGMLCIGCLENRLGRELKPADFLNCPLNSEPRLPRSPRLISRLG